MDRDITNLIERIELFEERLGVRLESLSAKIAAGLLPLCYINIMGELHVHDGMTLNQDTQLIFAIYDDAGRVIGASYLSCFKKKFYGFEVFNVPFNLGAPSPNISKIRIYPQAM